MNRTLFTIPEFLSPSECTRFIAAMEQRGFEAAPVTTARGFVMMPELRNNTRVIVDDTELAASLWTRLRERAAGHRIFEQDSNGRAVGLNERFRVYRYDPGQAFHFHRDGAFVRNDVERSRLTFMIYLNDDFGGGETEFEDERVRPERGMALVFAHGLRHQGATVTAGRKYVLRSDVMVRSDRERV